MHGCEPFPLTEQSSRIDCSYQDGGLNLFNSKRRRTLDPFMQSLAKGRGTPIHPLVKVGEVFVVVREAYIREIITAHPVCHRGSCKVICRMRKCEFDM